MANAGAAASRAPTTFTGGMVGLLALAIFLNYLDRGNLATAAPLIRDELRLSNTEIGLLVSAFFWVYAPGQLLAAWLVQKINAYRTLALGVALWSAATLLTGLSSGFLVLLGLRVMLGLGESAGFPASSKLLAQHLPPERLGFANGLIAVGQMLGPAVGTLLGGLLVVQAGWRVLFVVFGAGSLLWLVPWLASTRTLSRQTATHLSLVEPGFAELLSRRRLWGACVGHFATNYPFYLVISWLPIYLVKRQGFSMAAMAELGGATYALAGLTALLTGRLADRAIARGAAVSRVRLGLMVSANSLTALCMLVCAVGTPWMAIGALVMSQVANGLGASNLFTIGQTLGGPRGAGKWIGVQNAIGNIAGIVGPIITGVIIDRTGQFSLAFVAAAGVAGVGVLSWLFVVRHVTPETWAEAA